MRQLAKGPIPALLEQRGKQWLKEYLDDPTSETRKHRYRAAEIKEALRAETSWKCVYCESKIGHNTPGDVEHKVPSSKDPALHFEWTNLTIACTECNRRKNDYYDANSPFLDPYVDPVEDMIVHLGPLVYWRPGHPRAEVAVRVLQLAGTDRKQLLQLKVDVLEKARALLELMATANDSLRALREDELRRMQDVAGEYSGAVKSYVELVRSRGQKDPQ